MTMNIEQVHRPTDDVRALIGELDAELAGSYAPEQRHGLTIEAIFEPPVRFFIARKEGQAVGCGGVAFFSDFAELKRMYVRAAARGDGVADAIIEAWKTKRAMRDYASCGWRPACINPLPSASIAVTASRRAAPSNHTRRCRMTQSRRVTSWKSSSRRLEK